jgi:hypothetical protein
LAVGGGSFEIGEEERKNIKEEIKRGNPIEVPEERRK